MNDYRCNNALCQLAGSHVYNCLLAEVERLRPEVERLRAALERISKLSEWAREPHAAANWAVDIARAALERKP